MSTQEIGHILKWLSGLMFALFGFSFIVFDSATVSWSMFIVAMILGSIGKFLQSDQINGK